MLGGLAPIYQGRGAGGTLPQRPSWATVAQTPGVDGSEPRGEGDGADMWGRAVSGCGREEGAAAGLAAVLGRQRCWAGGWRWAERGVQGGRRAGPAWWGARPAEGKPAGRNSRRERKMNFAFFFFQIDFQKHFQIGFEFI